LTKEERGRKRRRMRLSLSIVIGEEMTGKTGEVKRKMVEGGMKEHRGG